MHPKVHLKVPAKAHQKIPAKVPIKARAKMQLKVPVKAHQVRLVNQIPKPNHLHRPQQPPVHLYVLRVQLVPNVQYESSLPAIRRPIMKHSVSWDQYGTISFLKLLSSYAIDLIIKLYINLQILVEVLLMFLYLSIVSPHTNRCISLLGATFLWPALGMSRYCDVSLLLTYNK